VQVGELDWIEQTQNFETCNQLKPLGAHFFFFGPNQPASPTKTYMLDWIWRVGGNCRTPINKSFSLTSFIVFLHVISLTYCMFLIQLNK